MSAFLLGVGFRADMGTCIRKLVLLKLIDACEDDGSRIFPAMRTVARAAQCSERQVQREIRAFTDCGLLRLVRKGGSGPRSTNEYALDLDLLHRIGRDGWVAVVGDAGENKGDTVSPLDEAEKGDTDDSARVTPETDKGDTRSHPTPPDSSIDPSSERARERETDLEEGDKQAEDTPGRAAFEKRVMRFCNGRGFAAGPWPDWDTSSVKWIAGRFAALSRGERLEAEAWRDAYLLDIKARGKNPAPVGNWLQSKTWTGLDPALLERARSASEKQARPDGWEPCLGPVGMAWLVAQLLAGPADPETAREPVLSDARLRQAWPSVWQWQAILRQKGGVPFGPKWRAMKGAMEFVPHGTPAMAAWKDEFARRGWRWLSVFDGGNGLYLPIGGPDGIETFETALARGNGDDGDRHEAAE